MFPPATDQTIIEKIAQQEHINRSTVYRNLSSGLLKLKRDGLLLDFARVLYLTHSQREVQKPNEAKHA
jgi:hypothetical protein